jgi:hypothetical protein
MPAGRSCCCRARKQLVARVFKKRMTVSKDQTAREEIKGQGSCVGEPVGYPGQSHFPAGAPAERPPTFVGVGFQEKDRWRAF